MTIDSHQAKKHSFRDVNACIDCHLCVREKNGTWSCEGGVFDNRGKRFVERMVCDMFVEGE